MVLLKRMKTKKMKHSDDTKDFKKLLNSVEDLVEIEEEGVIEWGKIANALNETNKNFSDFEDKLNFRLMLIEVTLILAIIAAAVTINA